MVNTVRQWKLSPMDLESLDNGTGTPPRRRRIFQHTDTDFAPWTVGEEQRQEARPGDAMRHVLSLFNYENEDLELIGEPDAADVDGRVRWMSESTASRAHCLAPRGS